MSDKRLQELGIPRRGFLKKAAATAFVAPVVASFGLDGIAEAGPGQYSNQYCPNQLFGNQMLSHVTFYVEQGMAALMFGAFTGVLSNGQARDAAQRLADAGVSGAGGLNADACDRLGLLTQLLERYEQNHPSSQMSDLVNGLLETISQMQTALGCSCISRH